MSVTTADLALPTTLRHEQAMAWLDGLQWPRGQMLQIDASPLSSFDSSALACLIELRRRVQAGGGQLQVIGLPERLQRLAQVYGLADLI
jgi:phospholipid transport system transporter-binding protein